MEHKIAEINISEILVDEDFNCRGHFAPIDVVDLAKDIERQGLIQPVTICLLDEPIEVDVKGVKVKKIYKLLAGFRRFKATALVLKKPTILSVVRSDKISDEDARIINLAENLHRKELNTLQEAKAIRHLFVTLTEEQIATKLGQSRGWVQIRAMLLKLPEEVQREVEVGMITHVHIRELYRIHRAGNVEKLYEAVREIKDKKLRGLSGAAISVNPNKVKPKRYRQRAEIERMTVALVNHGMRGLHTRALAWASGNLDNETFLRLIEEYAAENGINYTPITDEEMEAICVS